MTEPDDTPTQRAADPPRTAPARAPLIKRLQVFFGALDKQVRGVRLYKGEGAIVDQLARDLHDAGRAAVEDGAATLRVTPFGLSWQGKPVTDPAVRLPYLFRMYLDGIRELTLLPTLDAADIDRLVRLLAGDLRDDEDMVTLLWKADLQAVRVYAVDRFGAGVSAQDRASEAVAAGRGLGLHADGGGAEVALSADDVRVLRTDAVADWIGGAEAPDGPAPAHAAAAAALRQRLLLHRDPARFVTIAAQATSGEGEQPEASPLVLGVLDGFLAAQDGEAVAALLDRLGQDAAAADPALARLRDAALSPDRAAATASLVHADPDRFVPVLARLTRTAQDGLVALLTAMPGGAPAARVQQLLTDAGIDMTPYWAQRLQSGDDAEVLRAIEALGHLRSPRAAAALRGALGSTLGTVRRAALAAMVGSYDASVRDTLGRLLRDPDRDNRLMAAEILAESGDVQAARQLLRAMQEGDWRDRDAAERVAMVQALARFGDPRTVDFFTSLLEQRTAVGGRSELPLQRAAVDALAAIPGPAARAALERAQGRWLLAREVKEQIAQALARALREEG